MSSDNRKPQRDWPFANRSKQKSLLGTGSFVLLRSADVALQYALLASPLVPSLISRLGGRAISPTTTSTSFLGLTPYHSTILALSAGSAVKQIVWELFISAEMMTPTFAALISAFNTGCNTLNTVLSLWSMTSQAPSIHGTSPWSLSSLTSSHFSAAFYAGIMIYSIGISVELISEVQRKVFKSKPENHGKPYAGGLFGLATNINYGGYTLWRAGYAMACGGWAWGLFIGAGQAYDFISRAIPSMDSYISKKYGEDGVKTRDRVHWRLLPYIY